MLAGYITAATVDLARVRQHKGQIQLYDRMSVATGDFSDFESVMGLYSNRMKSQAKEAVLGVAGPVIGNEVRTTNIPWHVKATDIAREFGFEHVRLVNDLVATAHGLFFLGEDRYYTLNEGRPDRAGNIGLVAAGDGLGQALIYYDGARYRPYDSEGGHAGFSPTNQEQVELWEYLYAGKEYVEIEDVLSLSGIESLYRFIAERDRKTIADWFKKADSKADAVIEMALAGKDSTAVKAMDLFIDCYAAEVANLALKGMTLGGMHLAGLIAPRIITLLDQGRFVKNFAKKGKMQGLLATIPVKVVLDAKAALIGAAALAISHNR